MSTFSETHQYRISLKSVKRFLSYYTQIHGENYVRIFVIFRCEHLKISFESVDCIHLKYGPLVDSYEDGVECSDFVKGGEFLHQLNNLRNKDSAPWTSYLPIKSEPFYFRRIWCAYNCGFASTVRAYLHCLPQWFKLYWNLCVSVLLSLQLSGIDPMKWQTSLERHFITFLPDGKEEKFSKGIRPPPVLIQSASWLQASLWCSISLIVLKSRLLFCCLDNAVLRTSIACLSFSHKILALYHQRFP